MPLEEEFGFINHFFKDMIGVTNLVGGQGRLRDWMLACVCLVTG